MASDSYVFRQSWPKTVFPLVLCTGCNHAPGKATYLHPLMSLSLRLAILCLESLLITPSTLYPRSHMKPYPSALFKGAFSRCMEIYYARVSGNKHMEHTLSRSSCTRAKPFFYVLAKPVSPARKFELGRHPSSVLCRYSFNPIPSSSIPRRSILALRSTFVGSSCDFQAALLFAQAISSPYALILLIFDINRVFGREYYTVS